MCTFLLLSLLSGILETGVILSAYAAGRPMWEILALGSMYQLGNLLCFPEKLYSRTNGFSFRHAPDYPIMQHAARRNWIISAPVSIAPSRLRKLGIINLLLVMADLRWNNLAVTAIRIALSSLCIQAARARKKSACPTWLKRTFRIGGFLMAPLMIVFPRGMMLLCAVIPLAAVWGERDARGDCPEAAPGKTVSATMIFHQMHYFVYTYAMHLAVLELTHNPYICVTLYALTWVIYLLPGLAAEERKGYNPGTLFFICHSFLAVIMGLLTAAFATGNIKMGFGAWMLTGLGGGSVFCIRRLTKRDETCNMTLSENIGHFAGSLIAAAVSLAAGQGVYVILTALSFLFVCMTLLSAMAGIRKERGAAYGNAKQ